MPQPENMHFHFHALSGWALPEVKNWIWKHFSHKVLYNYYSKYFFGAIWFIFNKVKKGISHCSFKSCAEGFRDFVQARKLFFAKWLVLNRRGGPQSFDFDITYFISNYSYLKHVEYPFCEPIFHTLSETDSYATVRDQGCV